MRKSIGSTFLSFVLLMVLAISGCVPAPIPELTSTPVPPTDTLTPIPPTFTLEPTATFIPTPAPVCIPGATVEDGINDYITIGFLDITKVTTSLEGTTLTLVMTLREIPSEFTVNRKELPEGEPEITLGVAIDVDGDPNTGNPVFMTRSGYGFDVYLQVFKFKTSGSESTGAVENVFSNWYGVAEAADDGGITFLKNKTTFSVNLEDKTITLSADIPNISPDSYLSFYTFYRDFQQRDYQPLVDEVCQR